MKTTIKILGALIILIGIILLINPDSIFGWMENNQESKSFYFIAIFFRLAFGALLLMAAKQSNFPKTIKFLGYIAILAAIVFVIMGHQRFRDIIASLIPEFVPYSPVSGIAGLILGVFLIYAFTDKK